MGPSINVRTASVKWEGGNINEWLSQYENVDRKQSLENMYIDLNKVDLEPLREYKYDEKTLITLIYSRLRKEILRLLAKNACFILWI